MLLIVSGLIIASVALLADLIVRSRVGLTSRMGLSEPTTAMLTPSAIKASTLRRVAAVGLGPARPHRGAGRLRYLGDREQLEEICASLRQLSAWAVAAAFVPAFLSMGSAFSSGDADGGHGLQAAGRGRRADLLPQPAGQVRAGIGVVDLTQIELSRGHKIPKRTNVAVGVLVIAVSSPAGSRSPLCCCRSRVATIHRYWWIMLIIPVLLGALHPAVLGPALNLLLRLARRPPLPQTPSLGGMGLVAAMVGGSGCCWACRCGCAVGLGAPPARSLAVAVGGYALAYSLGQLAVGLPAGAGVREAALTVALSAVVPGPIALAVALLARGILTVVDLGMAGLQYLIGLRTKPLGEKPGARSSPKLRGL